MAPSYKLKYFNSRGLGEMSRLIFAYAGVDYEDVRLERGPQWDEFKPKTPFGVMPLLEVDGVVIGQSRAIARFLGRQFGLSGKNNLESARCDMLVDQLFDLYVPLRGWHLEQDATKKAELLKEFYAGPVTVFLDALQKFLQPNGYFVGDGITWADLALANGFWTLTQLNPTVLDKYPPIKSFTDRVLNLPKIKAWIDKRPVTAM